LPRPQLFPRLFHIVGDLEVQARLLQDLLAEFDVGSPQPHDMGTLMPSVLPRPPTPLATMSQAHDAAENVDEHGAHIGVAQNNFKAAAHLSFVAPPPTSRKSPAGCPLLDEFIGGQRPAPAPSHATTLPSQANVFRLI